jgi:integrase
MARPSKPWFRASKGTWYCTVNGKKVSPGVQGRENVKAATEAWHKLMAGLPAEEVSCPSTTAASTAAPTVNDVVKKFLADCQERVKPKTLRGYTDFLTPFVNKHGSLVVSDLTSSLVEAFSRRPQWSSTSQHDFLSLLSVVFRWAERARVIDRTPLLGLKKPPRLSRGAEVLVTPDEHERLLAAATPQFRLYLRILHATGARPGEVRAITAENFNAAECLVRLRDHKTAHKGKVRIIHLSPEVTAILQIQKEKVRTGPLLRNRSGKPWTDAALIKAMEATRERAGLDRKVCYGYRHTFATDALANGVPDAQVAELLGHSGTAMLHRHYSHLTARTRVLKDALSRVRGEAIEPGPIRKADAPRPDPEPRNDP